MRKSWEIDQCDGDLQLSDLIILFIQLHLVQIRKRLRLRQVIFEIHYSLFGRLKCVFQSLLLSRYIRKTFFRQANRNINLSLLS